MNQGIQTHHSSRLQRSLDVIAVLTFAVIAIGVLTKRSLSFDQPTALWIQALGEDRPWFHQFMSTITHFGDTITMILVTLSFAVIIFRITRSRRASYRVLLAYLFTLTANNLTKIIIERERPQLSTLYVDPSSYSFPSGHAMNSAAVYGTAAVLLSEAFPRYKWPIRLTAVVLVFAIGTSRVYLDAHWPSDVLAGFAAGWLITSIVRLIFPSQSAPR